MRAAVVNAQREAPVNPARIARLARRAVRRLKIRSPGLLAVTFISRQRMRALNRRFLRHDRDTDVLSFRYDDADGRWPMARRAGLRPPATGDRLIVGEILVAPAAARAYAKRHGLRYQEELARYVVHGLLHWLGHRDGTPREQARMRRMEDALLDHCGVLKTPDFRLQTSDSRQQTRGQRPGLRRRSQVSGLRSQVST
jgi:probable rRNA maturation factor